MSLAVRLALADAAIEAKTADAFPRDLQLVLFLEPLSDAAVRPGM